MIQTDNFLTTLWNRKRTASLRMTKHRVERTSRSMEHGQPEDFFNWPPQKPVRLMIRQESIVLMLVFTNEGLREEGFNGSLCQAWVVD